MTKEQERQETYQRIGKFEQALEIVSEKIKNAASCNSKSANIWTSDWMITSDKEVQQYIKKTFEEKGFKVNINKWYIMFTGTFKVSWS